MVRTAFSVTPDTTEPFGEAVDAANAAPGFTWVAVTNATREDRDALASAFGIHELSIEDVVNGVNAKIELFDQFTFVLVNEIELETSSEAAFHERIVEGPVGLFIGDGWAIALSTGESAAIDRVSNKIASGDNRLRSRGPDFAAYAVIDGIVDEYFAVLDAIEDRIEVIEERVVTDHTVELLESITATRKDLVMLRRVIWPARNALTALARGDSDQVAERNEKYYRDVLDHLVHIVELIETYRDIVAGMRDIYLNAVSMSTNEVMKTLTIVATIILPLTFIAGIYGMNFSGSPYNMPELTWQFGYPAVLGVMAVTTVALLLFFQRRDWL